ncbi:hypothetical protein PIB30_061598 [Stylosanthes scabra]|uniref:X8 domain-containing protein n=1 Tax=Stylosanthes scabra TaxID=79078 RepID=A0ABU6UMJ2_9FABA|nr:hypothetical protein [Stylosanthes scabra]
MGTRVWCLGLFSSLCLFFASGLSRATILRDDEHKEISYQFNTQLDSVPIVNPTTPGTASPFPTLNPTTPQSPFTTGPSPPTPTTTTTSPPTYMTPTNPTTSPNTNPYTSPSTSPTTVPTSPNANPTTPTSPTTFGGGGGGGVGVGGGGGSGGGSSGQWCIASASAQDKALKVALDYACGYGADCSAIQPGASCYNPDTLKDHASYAFNDYYQKNPAPTSCSFGGTATLTNKDPSNGNCHYSSSKSSSMSPPTTTTYGSPPNGMMSPPTTGGTTMTPTPPGGSGTTMTPSTPSMTIPDGASVYGPTTSPNIATPHSQSFMLLFLCLFVSPWAFNLV